MQSFGELFANNKLLAVGIVLAAIAVILAVGIALFRLVFGRRLHMAGGRTRQPRLGVVDAFDLDRQRQLVLIRRDNVEHLLMIGGPNDVLVEAAIVRAPAALGPRDKENGFTPSVGIPAPMPQQPAVALPATPTALPVAASAPAGGPEGGSNLPFPAPLPPEPKVDAASEVRRPTLANEPSASSAASQPPTTTPEGRLPPAATLPATEPRPLPAASPRPASNLPPRPPVTPVARPPVSTATPRPNFSRATPVAPPPATPAADARQPSRVEPALNRQQPDGQVSGDRTAPDQARESAPAARFPASRTLTRRGEEPAPASGPAVPPQAQPSSSSTDTAPLPPRSAPAEPRPAAPAAARPLPPRTPSPAPAPAQTRAPLPSLGSLEEEMAKLLGRPMPPSDTSNSGS